MHRAILQRSASFSNNVLTLSKTSSSLKRPRCGLPISLTGVDLSSRRSALACFSSTSNALNKKESNELTTENADVADNSTIPSTKNTPRSVYDTSDNWEDWFSPEEYGNPFEESPTSSQNKNRITSIRHRRSMVLEPLVDDPALDASSRYLIHLLQTVYHQRYRTEATLSTERCHVLISRLLQSAEKIEQQFNLQEDRQEKEHHDAASRIRQRVMRAEAIFRTMELFWDYVPDIIDPSSPNIITHPDMERNPPNRRTIVKIHRHSPFPMKPNVKWPLPSYELYVMITRALASLRAHKKYQSVRHADVPWICQALVIRMHRLYQEKGFVYLQKPRVEDWNQVLACWANTHGGREYPEKSVNATQVFMDMKLLYKITPDASSYNHVFRACAHHDENPKAKELGAKVALKFWKGVAYDDLKSQSFTPGSHMFAFLLRALENLSTNEKQEVIPEIWKEACTAGVVNEHVVSALEKTDNSFFQIMRKPYKDMVLYSNVRHQGHRVRNEELSKVLPKEWTENAGLACDLQKYNE